MSITDRFFSVLKDVVILAEETKRLNRAIEKHDAQIDNVRERLVRLETMVEIAQQRRLPSD